MVQSPGSRRSGKSSQNMAPLMRKSLQMKPGGCLLGGTIQQPQRVLTAQGTALLNFITVEVQKFLASKRVNERTIRELDQKIQMECYLREKKEAILEDRKNEMKGPNIIVSGSNGDYQIGHPQPQLMDDDQKSCL